MKTLVYSILFSSILFTHLSAEPQATEPAADQLDMEVTIDTDDNVDRKVLTDDELEKKIKGKVFSIIADIIDAAGDEMTEDEKAEIKQDIKEAIQDIEEVKHGKDDDEFMDGIDFDNDNMTFMEALIPLTALTLGITFVFGTPLMIVAAVLYFSYRKKRLMHATIDQYVSSGKDIPQEVLNGLQKEVAPKNNLHRGLVMSGIGLGIFACFFLIDSIEAAALGLIPLFIGLAQLLIWKLENK